MSADAILSEEHRTFRKEARHFLEREVGPLVEEAERTGEAPPGLLRKLGEAGYLGIRYPEEVGGSGGDFLTACLFMEEFYRVSAGLATMAEIQIDLATMPLYLAGTPEQQDRYLRPALAGQLLGAFALTEPEAGSDAGHLRTSARWQQDGWLLNGTKMFITNGSRADFVIVAARTGGEGSKGVSLFVVDRGTPGFSAGRRLQTLGLRASDTAEIVLQDVVLPRDALVGQEGSGFRIVMRTLNEGRIMVGAESVGLATAALEAATAYVKVRRQFGQEIGKFQAVRFRLADMATQVAAAHLLVYSAAASVDAGTITPGEAAMAKLFASETASWVAKDALHLHGGYGYMMEFPVQRYLRDALVNEIVEGTSEIQRETIARGLGL